MEIVDSEVFHDEASILVNRARPVPFEQASALFESIDEKLSEAFVEVYAPVVYQTPAERRALRGKLSGPIKKILEGATQ